MKRVNEIDYLTIGDPQILLHDYKDYENRVEKLIYSVGGLMII